MGNQFWLIDLLNTWIHVHLFSFYVFVLVVDLNYTYYMADLAETYGEPLEKRQRVGDGGVDESFLKILLTNMAAGTVTGKGGSTIKELQHSTGATVKLSSRSVYFPGTQERVALLLGSRASVEQAMLSVLQILSDIAAGGNDPNTPACAPGFFIVRFVLSNSAVTKLMGARGADITELSRSTGTRLQFSHKGELFVHNQRTLTIEGPIEGVQAACAAVLNRIQGDANMPNIMLVNEDAMQNPTADHARQSHRSPQVAYVPAPPAADQRHRRANVPGLVPAVPPPPPARIPTPPPKHSKQPQQVHATFADAEPQYIDDVYQTPVEICFDVSDVQAGTIMGRGGDFIRQLTGQTRANVKLSNKGNQPPGLLPGMRRVFLRGTMEAVHAAHAGIVQQLLEQPDQSFQHDAIGVCQGLVV